MLGPLAGGELLALASWRWIFLINLPLAVVCVSLIMLVIPPGAKRGAHARQIDFVGALLCVGGLGGPVFALIEQPRLGWSSAAVLAPLIAGVCLLALFIAFESRARDPMLPLGLFRRRNFAAGNVETFSMYAGLSILFFFLVLFLQQIGGYTPLQSGLATLPVTRDHVRALTPLRRARRPLRPASVHGRGAARGGGRPAAVPARRG